jgi:hypothetical protein
MPLRALLRRSLKIAAAVSLLLSLAAGAQWVRSHRAVDSWVGQLGHGHYKLVTMKGLAALHWEPAFAYRADYHGYHTESLRSGPTERGVDRASMFGRLDENAVWAAAGFSFSRHTSCPAGSGCWRVSAPLWAVSLLLLIVPVYQSIVVSRRRLRTAGGRCPSCGYALRATPDCCPECGAVPREPPHNAPMQRTATASSGPVE